MKKSTGNLSAACALLAASALAAEGIRFAAGPLARSVRNESDAAIDRACAWLAARQNADGSWGSANLDYRLRGRLTAICALAIGGDGPALPPGERQTLDRALQALQPDNALWGNGPAAAPGQSRLLSARDWRAMAVYVLSREKLPRPPAPPSAGADAERAILLEWPALEASLLLDGTAVPRPASTNADPCVRFVSDTLAGAGDAAHREALAGEVARAWDALPPDAIWKADPAAAWWLARSANRAAGGELALPTDADGATRPLPWRGELANRWTVSQKTDSRGAGHWVDDGATDDEGIEATAFAVLLLKEL